MRETVLVWSAGAQAADAGFEPRSLSRVVVSIGHMRDRLPERLAKCLEVCGEVIGTLL